MNLIELRNKYKQAIITFLNNNAINCWIHRKQIIENVYKKLLSEFNFINNTKVLDYFSSTVVFSKIIKEIDEENDFLNDYKFVSSQKGYQLTKNKSLLLQMAKSLNNRANKLIERAKRKTDLLNEVKTWK